MTKEKKLKKGPLKGYTITSAPQDRITRLEAQVDKILIALGHREAWVTDESMINDFDIEEHELEKLSADLGVKVSLDDYIADVAERMIGGQ